MTTKDYFSYSGLSTYMKCGKEYELGRVRNLEEAPTWWLLGGKAVHTVTEQWDGMVLQQGTFFLPDFDVAARFQQVFDLEVERQSTESPDLGKWRSTKKTKANPMGEDYLGWMDVGPEFIQNYIVWRQANQQPIWITPQGVPAIELSIVQRLPGGEQIKGFIDRVFVHPNGQDLIVVDLKTSSRVPETDLQLGTYAACLEKEYGVHPRYGMYYMNRLNKAAGPYELENYTPDYIGQMGTQLAKSVASGIFMPHKTFLCKSCSFNQSCYTWSGDTPLTRKNDTMNPRYNGPR